MTRQPRCLLAMSLATWITLPSGAQTLLQMPQDGAATTAASTSQEIPQPSQGEGSQAELEQAVATLRQLEALGVAEFDIEGKARALGDDPASLFTFVRDEISTEVYRGMLRGAEGALASRAANDLDKALLLQALLRVHGHEARLARGLLSDAGREELFKAAAARSQGSGGGTAEDLVRLQRKVTAREQRYRSQLLTVLEKAGVELSSTPPSMEPWPHYYIVATVAGQDVVLDPAFPGVAWGQEVATARQELDQVPSDEVHSVSLRLMLETRLDQGFETDELLSLTSSAAELSGRSILLFYRLGASRKDLLGLGGKGTPYTPVLLIEGREALEGKSFGEAGTGGGGGLLGEAFDSAEGKEPAQVTGQWIEFEIRSPGRRVTRVHRYLLDRVGPASRDKHGVPIEGTTPLAWTRIEGTPTPFLGLYAVGVLCGPANPVARYARLAPELLRLYQMLPPGPVPGSSIEEGLAELFAELPASGQEQVAALADRQIAATALDYLALSAALSQSALEPARLTADGPSLSLIQFGFAGAEGATATVSMDLDATVRSLTLVGPGGRAAAKENLRVGLLALAVEAVLTEEAARGYEPAAAPQASTLPLSSVGAVLDRAQSQGVALKILDRADLETGQLANLGPAAKALIQSKLSPDRLLVGPEQPVGELYAILTIDPESGELGDVLEGGTNGSKVEWIITNVKAAWHATAAARCIWGKMLMPVAVAACVIKGSFPLPTKPLQWWVVGPSKLCYGALFLVGAWNLFSCAKLTPIPIP